MPKPKALKVLKSGASPAIFGSGKQRPVHVWIPRTALSAVLTRVLERAG